MAGFLFTIKLFFLTGFAAGPSLCFTSAPLFTLYGTYDGTDQNNDVQHESDQKNTNQTQLPSGQMERKL